VKVAGDTLERARLVGADRVTMVKRIAAFLAAAREARGRGGAERLPYDRSNPVIYDKDAVANCYTDDYLMALASAGDIRLVGMVTSSSVAPFNPWVSAADFRQWLVQRAEGVDRARRAGFSHLPDPVRGPDRHLERPASGRIEDTRPLGSEGSCLVVREARRAEPGKPLTLVMCGPLTLAADAYLLDPSIADKVVVAWFGGRKRDMGDYNGWADPWAAYIVLQRLRLVQFSVEETGRRAGPLVPKARLLELPPSPLRQWMIEKQHNGQPGDLDQDAPPAISLMRPDFIRAIRRVSFGGWVRCRGRDVPAFRDDRNGLASVVTATDQATATAEWWRALKNPKAYGMKK
jgi:hypothetical protein